MTAKIKLNAASGGGSISIQAPSSSSNNRVIALPDIADGTMLTDQSTGLGKIVKTSYVSTASFSDGTSTSYFDVSNLTVNHTPLSASNTLHVVAHIQCLVIKTGGYEGSIGIRILKDSTEISAIELRSKNYAYNSNSSSGVRDCVTGILDAQVSAGGTSQITFKCQIKKIDGALVSVNPGNESGGTDSDQSSITIFEIAP